MIDVLGVTKRFGDFTAISDLSFHVDKGTMYGLVGYNGAGKTTLLKTISDVYRADGGEVRICSENVLDNAKMKQKIFYVPDDLYFQPYSSMTKMAKFYDDYYPNFSLDTFSKLADVFKLDKTARINGFSKGMQRQAELVLAMAANPEILLLDESFDGLDPQKRNLVKNLVLEVVQDRGTTIIISSHNLHELGDLCGRIGLINGKKLALDCSVEEMSGSRSKFRAVFDRDFAESELEGITHKNFKKDGRMITFTAGNEKTSIEARLKELGALVVEEFPLSLEEVFLDEMEGTDYDFSEIFKK